MGKKVVTDYETVAVKKEKYECDHCGSLVDEGKINTVGYTTGEAYNGFRSTDETKHLCEGCVGLREALEIREKKEYFREWWNGTRQRIAWLLLLLPTFAIGMATMRFAYEIHQTADEPIWVFDIFFSAILMLAIAWCGGVAAQQINKRISGD